MKCFIFRIYKALDGADVIILAKNLALFLFRNGSNDINDVVFDNIAGVLRTASA